MKRNYIGFAKMGNLFGPAQGAGEYTPTLPAGHYKVEYDQYEDMLAVTQFQPKVDEILTLGNIEFDQAVKSSSKFLAPETAKAFADHGYLLKRSFLFHGPPGTGKSVLACKIADLSVKMKDAVALYPNDYQALERILEVLDETDKNRFKTISLEEFDDLISSRDEASWTSLLDGQFQSANRLLLATTNNIERLPKRLLRPGRFSSLILIPSLTAAARFNYLKAKGMDEKMCVFVAEHTEGFTVDDLKEVVQNSMLLGEEINAVLNIIKASKTLGKDRVEDVADSADLLDE